MIIKYERSYSILESKWDGILVTALPVTITIDDDQYYVMKCMGWKPSKIMRDTIAAMIKNDPEAQELLKFYLAGSRGREDRILQGADESYPL